MNLWWKEYLNFSERDQMSILFAVYSNNLKLNVIDENVNNNKYDPKLFYEFSEKIKNKGATILGGCCETRPSHIEEIAKLK